MTQEEIVNYFIQTMQAHAEPRNYDWAMYFVAIGGVAVSAYAIWFTRKIYKEQIKISGEQIKIAEKQKDIAKQQNELLEEQTQISKQQAGIAEQQNTIALFKMRFHIFTLVRQIYMNVDRLPNSEGSIKESYKTPTKIRELCLRSLYFNITANFSTLDEPLETVILYIRGEILKILSHLESTRFVFYLDDENQNALLILVERFEDFTSFLLNCTEEIEDTLIFDKILEIKLLYEESSLVKYLDKQVYISDSFKNSIW